MKTIKRHYQTTQYCCIIYITSYFIIEIVNCQQVECKRDDGVLSMFVDKNFSRKANNSLIKRHG